MLMSEQEEEKWEVTDDEEKEQSKAIMVLFSNVAHYICSLRLQMHTLNDFTLLQLTINASLLFFIIIWFFWLQHDKSRALEIYTSILAKYTPLHIVFMENALLYNEDEVKMGFKIRVKKQ